MSGSSKSVIIVGGSISGLMHGILLRSHGYNVTIVEQHDGSPDSQMAGIGYSEEVKEFLDRFDRVKEPIGLPCKSMQSLSANHEVNVLFRFNRIMTTWDMIYHRLRANFDGLSSAFCPNPPSLSEIEARASTYLAGRRVRRVWETGSSVSIEVEGSRTRGVETMKADLVLGADGYRSIVRETFLGKSTVEPRYAGFIAWRGVICEEDISAFSRKYFQEALTFCFSTYEYAIVYAIPGDSGALESGKRFFNFVWYSNQSLGAANDILRDVNGNLHYSTVPSGKVRPELWKSQQEVARSKFPKALVEIINKIESPFVHLVRDHASPKASFAGGKVLLVGDALTLLRPNIGFSANNAAHGCFVTEKLIEGKISAAEWEAEVLKFGRLHWLRSIWYGEWFLRPLIFSVWGGFAYWMAAAADVLRKRESLTVW